MHRLILVVVFAFAVHGTASAGFYTYTNTLSVTTVDAPVGPGSVSFYGASGGPIAIDGNPNHLESFEYFFTGENIPSEYDFSFNEIDTLTIQDGTGSATFRYSFVVNYSSVEDDLVSLLFTDIQFLTPSTMNINSDSFSLSLQADLGNSYTYYNDYGYAYENLIATAIPEPSSLAMLATGATSIVFLTRRGKAARLARRGY
jgi:hypothetical protein